MSLCRARSHPSSWAWSAQGKLIAVIMTAVLVCNSVMFRGRMPPKYWSVCLFYKLWSYCHLQYEVHVIRADAAQVGEDSETSIENSPKQKESVQIQDMQKCFKRCQHSVCCVIQVRIAHHVADLCPNMLSARIHVFCLGHKLFWPVMSLSSVQKPYVLLALYAALNSGGIQSWLGPTSAHAFDVNKLPWLNSFQTSVLFKYKGERESSTLSYRYLRFGRSLKASRWM